MNNYKDRLYENYVSTHILTRKGRATLDEFKHRSLVYQKRFGRSLPQEKTAKIIDIGCGNGSVVWWLHQSGFTNTEGIDISFEQIEAGQKLGIKNIKKADAKEFLIDKRRLYDVIFLRDLLEHFNKEEMIEVLDLCYLSLKDKGTVIIQVPNAESPFFGRIRYGDLTHEIAFSTSSLSQLLRMTGFSEIRFFSTEPLIFGIKSFIRYILWKIIESFYKFFLFAELGRAKRIVTQNIISIGVK